MEAFQADASSMDRNARIADLSRQLEKLRYLQLLDASVPSERAQPETSIYLKW
jgi:hypothetical protein